MPRNRGFGIASAVLLILAAWTALAQAAPPVDPATAVRDERRRAVKEGRLKLPLPGTPDTNRPLDRLTAAGVELGAPVFLRVFKAESELELWIQRKSRYVLFATYPICYWSGGLGPKLREGDRQTPEGFYLITEKQLHRGGRWRRSLNIGYPNPFDRVQGRTGSLILIHGGCDSIGCFAMTNAVSAELHDVVAASLRAGNGHVPVHVFPFRMTPENLAAHAESRWAPFWADLKAGYDSFERTRAPPRVSVCDRRYRVEDASPFMRTPDHIDVCPADRELIAKAPEQAEPKPSAETARAAGQRHVARAAPPPPRCNMSRPSCRRWVALRDRRDASRMISGRIGPSKRTKIR